MWYGPVLGRRERMLGISHLFPHEGTALIGCQSSEGLTTCPCNDGAVGRILSYRHAARPDNIRRFGRRRYRIRQQPSLHNVHSQGATLPTQVMQGKQPVTRREQGDQAMRKCADDAGEDDKNCTTLRVPPSSFIPKPRACSSSTSLEMPPLQVAFRVQGSLEGVKASLNPCPARA